MVDDLCNNQRRWLWVLAPDAQLRIWAGTTISIDLRSRQLHRLAATAGTDLVGIVEDELGLHLVGLVVHLGTEQEQDGLGIDQDLDALVLVDFVGRAAIMGVFDREGRPGAAAVLHADAQADGPRMRALGQPPD